MAELPLQVPGGIATSDYINDVAARTVQRYDDQAQLDSLNPTPDSGDLAWLEDVQTMQMFDGLNWGAWFSGNGVRSIQVTASVLAGPRDVPGQPVIRTVTPGSAAAPTYTFHQYTDAGLWADAAAIRISRGGDDVFSVGNFCTIPAVDANTSGSAANVFVESGGQSGRLLRSTSARRYKSGIRYAN